MTEEQLLAAVTEACGQMGVWWVHLPDSRTAGGQAKGFPDLLLAGKHGVAFAELKGSWPWRLRPDQLDWKYRLQAARQPFYLWTPLSLESGLVHRILKTL